MARLTYCRHISESDAVPSLSHITCTPLGIGWSVPHARQRWPAALFSKTSVKELSHDVQKFNMTLVDATDGPLYT